MPRIDDIYIAFSGVIECYINVQDRLNISYARTNITVLAWPRVEISNHTFTLMEGEELNLTCTASVEMTGHPGESVPPAIKWYRHEVKIDPGDRMCTCFQY